MGTLYLGNAAATAVYIGNSASSVVNTASAVISMSGSSNIAMNTPVWAVTASTNSTLATADMFLTALNSEPFCYFPAYFLFCDMVAATISSANTALTSSASVAVNAPLVVVGSVAASTVTNILGQVFLTSSFLLFVTVAYMIWVLAEFERIFVYKCVICCSVVDLGNSGWHVECSHCGEFDHFIVEWKYSHSDCWLRALSRHCWFSSSPSEHQRFVCIERL